MFLHFSDFQGPEWLMIKHDVNDDCKILAYLIFTGKSWMMRRMYHNKLVSAPVIFFRKLWEQDNSSKDNLTWHQTWHYQGCIRQIQRSVIFNDLWFRKKYPSKHCSIRWTFCGMSWPRRVLPLSTPGVSASVLLAASYSDNNAIIEGLALSRSRQHSYYSQHGSGCGENIIGELGCSFDL